ncbi:MAG: signal recognition particle protein [Synergistaceae bacterium]|jgi:signal recognition particle subunit SRP54|nr:signal recognition particle protein [Synergistaceae bacterium]
MFEALKQRFESVFSGLRGKGKLTADDVTAALREVRRALLEADVNFKVVRDLVDAIRVRATGADVLNSITPAQQVATIVYEELINIMGREPAPMSISPKPPTVYMMVGLQGSGKTTTTVKLAKRFSRSHKPLVVACDLRRPAAVEQLRVLAEKAGVAFFGPEQGESDPVAVAERSIAYAEDHLCSLILLDTAGRLQMDDELMNELESMKTKAPPFEVLLVVDSMTGQEAVEVSNVFNKRLGLTGVILTKMDGDARGGPALAIKSVTGVPIKMAGMGERVEDIEPFDSKRMASRIMGMGDMMGLMEKLERTTTDDDAERLAESLKKNRFTMEDMLLQLQQIKKLGPLDKIFEMLPMLGSAKALKGANVDMSVMKYTEAIIQSMTLKERRSPEIIKGSRRRRIAKGSGTSVQQVNQVLAQFEQMKNMMKSLGMFGKAGPKSYKLKGMMKNMFKG